MYTYNLIYQNSNNILTLNAHEIGNSGALDFSKTERNIAHMLLSITCANKIEPRF